MSYVLKCMRSFIPNACFGVLFAFSALLPDYIFQAIYKQISYSTDIAFIFLLIGFGTALSLSGRWFFYSFMSLCFICQLIQLFHIGYFGRPINPIDISKIWMEFGDIYETGVSSMGELWFIPVMLTGCFATLCWVFHKHAGKTRYSAYAAFICIAALAVWPVNASYKSLRVFLPAPSRYSIHNTLKTFSFFAVQGWKINHIKSIVPEDFYEKYTVAPLPPNDRKPRLILLIIGESLTSNYMSIFTGHDNTTPNLDRMKYDANLMALPAVSGSVSTHSSLALFFGVVREPGNIRTIESEKTNLFRLAKTSGYETYFISAQNAEQTHAIGTAYIDDIRTVEDELIGFALNKDFHFIPILDDIMKKGGDNKFIVFNFRAIHSPYASAYQWNPEYKVFPTDVADSTLKRRNEYKNAMRYVDALLKSLLENFAKYDDGSGVFAVISDHGESLGEDNLWGHTVLSFRSAESPFLLYSRQLHSLPKKHVENKKIVTHYEIGKLLANIFGFEIVNPNEVEGLFYINGSHLYQDCDFMAIERDSTGYFVSKYISVIGDHVKNNSSRHVGQPYVPVPGS